MKCFKDTGGHKETLREIRCGTLVGSVDELGWGFLTWDWERGRLVLSRRMLVLHHFLMGFLESVFLWATWNSCDEELDKESFLEAIREVNPYWKNSWLFCSLDLSNITLLWIIFAKNIIHYCWCLLFIYTISFHISHIINPTPTLWI